MRDIKKSFRRHYERNEFQKNTLYSHCGDALHRLLPIGAAADSYAAAAELRSMQKVRREIDGELFELESELDSDLSAVETVDSLFEYLDGDSRIKSINRQNGTTFGYTLKSGMTVVYDYNIVHGIREGSEPVKIELSPAEAVRGILDDGAVTASNRNVAV